MPNESGTLLTSNSTLPNSNLSNSSITIGSTATNLGATNTTIAGLSSITSTDIISTTTKATTIKTNATNRVAPAFQNSSGTEIGRICKAYVNFNGQGTVAIRDDFNVSSNTDNGTGKYTINFSNNMADSNYTTSIGADARSPNSRLTAIDYLKYDTTGVRVTTVDPTSQYNSMVMADNILITVAIFGNT